MRVGDAARASRHRVAADDIGVSKLVSKCLSCTGNDITCVSSNCAC